MLAQNMESTGPKVELATIDQAIGKHSQTWLAQGQKEVAACAVGGTDQNYIGLGCSSCRRVVLKFEPA